MSSIKSSFHVIALSLALALSFSVHSNAERIEGVVKPSRQVMLGVPVEGIVSEIKVKEGQRVTAGVLIAQMDDAMQSVAVQAAELRAASTAEVDNAELVLEESRIMVERVTDAQASDAASEWEVRRTKLQAEQAKAQLQAAKEARQIAAVQLELEKEKLARYRVQAPFDGRVLRIEAEAGANLTRQDKLMSLVALQPLEAEFYLPHTLYGELKAGKVYALATDESIGRPLQGELVTIDPVIDPASLTFRVVLRIDNENESLPSGFPVWLETGEAELSKSE